MSFNFKDFVKQFFEVNSHQNIKRDDNFQFEFHAKSPMVEIFSAIVNDKDYSKYGKNVDVVMNHVKGLAQRVSQGDSMARHELNTIQCFAIEPQLLNEIKLASFFGDHKQIGFDVTPMVTSHKHESIRSSFQASQGDVSLPTTSWEEYPIKTQTISSGFAVNYREIASGNLDKVSEGIQQVKTDMMNNFMLYIVATLYNAIKNANGVKYFKEANGIVKASVDEVMKDVRPNGRPSLVGDYNVISQLNDFAGFKADASDLKNTFLSQAVMQEIMQTGLLKTYNGAPVVEIPNQYNFTKLTPDGKNFTKYLPEGLLFVLPQGGISPLQTFQRGGLTSMSANDITTGTEITRFDMEIAADVVKGREYEIGLISDTSYEVQQVGQ
ncbi:hypothetical protein [Paenibacillus taichungensis]